MRKKGFHANRRERPLGRTADGVMDPFPAPPPPPTPVGCSRQRPCSELCSPQGPRATGCNKPSRDLPSHLVLIYALTGTCIEMWAWKGHVPHILPPTDSRGAHRAAWLVHLLGLPLDCLFAELAGPPLLPARLQDSTQPCPASTGWAYPPHSSEEQNEARVTDQDTCVLPKPSGHLSSSASSLAGHLFFRHFPFLSHSHDSPIEHLLHEEQRSRH